MKDNVYRSTIKCVRLNYLERELDKTQGLVHFQIELEVLQEECNRHFRAYFHIHLQETPHMCNNTVQVVQEAKVMCFRLCSCVTSLPT